MDTYLKNFVGKLILFKVSKQFLIDARWLLQPNEDTQTLYGRLIAVDGIGIWIENPTWRTANATNQ